MPSYSGQYISVAALLGISLLFIDACHLILDGSAPWNLAVCIVVYYLDRLLSHNGVRSWCHRLNGLVVPELDERITLGCSSNPVSILDDVHHKIITVATRSLRGTTQVLNSVKKLQEIGYLLWSGILRGLKNDFLGSVICYEINHKQDGRSIQRPYRKREFRCWSYWIHSAVMLSIYKSTESTENICSGQTVQWKGFPYPSAL